MYKLNCYRSLALVKGESEASKAYTGGAYADGACVDKAYADGACADRACISRACADGACADRKLFKTARARARVADNVKGVDECDLRQ